jgi:hypothetical protein
MLLKNWGLKIMADRKAPGAVIAATGENIGGDTNKQYTDHNAGSSQNQEIGHLKFLDAIYGTPPDGEVICVSEGLLNGEGKVWFNNMESTGRLVRRWDPVEDPCAMYVCVATVNGETNDKGRLLRRRVNLKQAYLLVLDDIGTKATAPPGVEPTYKIETSPGNFQYGYRLEPTDRFDEFEALVSYCAGQGWSDAGAGGAYRVVRIPGSCNLKPKNKGFLARITEWDPDRVWSLDDLAAEMGCDLKAVPAAPAERDQADAPVLDAGDDPYMRLLGSEGLILTGKIHDGKLDIQCPFGDHEPGASSSTVYYVGSGSFSCIHETCAKRKSPDFRRKLLSLFAEAGGDAAAIEAEFAEATAPDWVREMNATYALVAEGGSLKVMSHKVEGNTGKATLERMREHDFLSLFQNQFVTTTDPKGNEMSKAKGSAWLAHPARRTCANGTVMSPGGVAPDGFYNIWLGWGVDPAPGDWSKMQDHIRNIICGGDEDEFDYVLDWCARAVQQPNAPAKTALVMRGDKQIGKGLFANALAEMLGAHGLAVQTRERMTGKFNLHLQGKVIVFADEAFFAGDARDEGLLKAMITEPYLQFEGKGTNAFTDLNRLHLIMATNSDYAVPASPDEPRYVVLDVLADLRGDRDYFKAIGEELNTGGLAAMLHDLLARDISRFNPQEIPRTDGLLEQKIENFDSIHGWLFKRLGAGAMPGMAACGDNTLPALPLAADWSAGSVHCKKDALYTDYVQFAESDRKTWSPVGRSLLFRKLRAVLVGQVSDYREINQPRSLAFAPLDQCRAAFEVRMEQKMNWDDA